MGSDSNGWDKWEGLVQVSIGESIPTSRRVRLENSFIKLNPKKNALRIASNENCR